MNENIQSTETGREGAWMGIGFGGQCVKTRAGEGEGEGNEKTTIDNGIRNGVIIVRSVE
jgi:hypothetical protein